MLDNIIDKGFTNQIIELENGWIETPNGIFTPNEEMSLSAYEVYENYLYNLNNPPIQEPTLEEKVQLQECKISDLQEENKNLKIEQEQQNEEILVNMLANTEMFEMMLITTPIVLDTKQSKVVSNIINVYTSLIEKGLKTIDEVPFIIREEVENLLRCMSF